jgi:hypothetical protein
MKQIIVNSKEKTVKVSNSIMDAFGTLSSAISNVQNACDKLLVEFEGNAQASSKIRAFEKDLVAKYMQLVDLKKPRV